MSHHVPDHLKVVYLPVLPNGGLAPHACPHLAQVDERGRVVRFFRMTRTRLLRAEGGEAVLRLREERGRLRRFLSVLPCSAVNPWLRG
jgi:hypothetical protein